MRTFDSFDNEFILGLPIGSFVHPAMIYDQVRFHECDIINRVPPAEARRPFARPFEPRVLHGAPAMTGWRRVCSCG